jgi:undecaprenyl-diphosphatase
MPDTIEAVLLGLLQGVLEFLPISSSGHLLLAQHFFGMDPERFGFAFDMTLHLGTLLAVVWFYKRDIWEMIGALARSLPRPRLADPTERLAYLVLLATVPAVVAGLLLQDLLESTLRSPWLVAAGFVISGALFLLAEGSGKQSQDNAASLSFPRATTIGLGQVASLLYGVSRSGSTMAFGLLVGLKRTEAAKFSFLMSIPITAGAIAVEVPDLVGAGDRTGNLGLFVLGLVVSAVTAYFTIRFLLSFFARHTLRPFAYYCFFAAAVVCGLLLLGL